MRLVRAWLDRHNALRNAEKKWEKDIAAFRASVPAHLKEIAQNLLPNDDDQMHCVMIGFGDLEYGFEIPGKFERNEKNSPTEKELLAKLVELKQLWKNDFVFSFEILEYEIVVTAKANVPPMSALRMYLENKHDSADCSWIQIPGRSSPHWSMQFKLKTLEILIDYDEEKKEFTVLHSPDDKIIFSSIDDVHKHITERVTSYFGH